MPATSAVFNVFFISKDIFSQDIFSQDLLLVDFITKTRLFKYIDNFTTEKGKISDTKNDVFQTSAQKIDCEYLLEPPRQCGSKEYQRSMFFNKIRKKYVHPCKPEFYYVKVEFKGVKIV